VGSAKSTDASKINLYSCDDKEKCLNPTIKPSTVDGKDSFLGRIGDLVMSIAQKIQKDVGPYTEQEETLIALSSLSLITRIELDLSNYSNIEHASIAQAEFVEALSFDVVTTYLTKLLQEVQAAVGELEFAQIADSGAFLKFDLETRETMRALRAAKNDAFRRYDLIAQTKARLKQEISYFEFKFEEFCSGQNEI